MTRRRREGRHRPPRASAPGIMPLAAGARGGPARMTATHYTPDTLEEKALDRIEEAFVLFDRPEGVTWLNLDGIPAPDVLQALGNRLHLHPLALEDVQHPAQRPKLESYHQHEFLIMRMLTLAEELESEQVAVFFGPRFVVTIQERTGDVFDPVRARLRREGSVIRGAGSDYLLYALHDAVVDAVFPVVDALSDKLADLEERVIGDPPRTIVREIHALKRHLIDIRHDLGPTRDVVNALQREDMRFVTPPTRVYLRDCYDHVVRVIELLETYREMAGGLMDVYLSSVSNRMNEVMKVLTIIATLFIPLSFLAGVFGMNFNTDRAGNMPELNWPYGYLYFWAVCVAVAGGLLYYFRRKRWL